MSNPEKHQRKPASAGESGVGTSPWRKDGPHVYDSDGRVVVSICHTCPTSKDVANLTLAAAAPELREALEAVSTLWDHVQTCNSEPCRTVRDRIADPKSTIWHPAYKLTRAALAKAGRAPAGPLEPKRNDDGR